MPDSGQGAASSQMIGDALQGRALIAALRGKLDQKLQDRREQHVPTQVAGPDEVVHRMDKVSLSSLLLPPCGWESYSASRSATTPPC